MLVFFLTIVNFVVSSVSTDDLGVVGQLTQTLYATLLEELRGDHLRIAATNVTIVLKIIKILKSTWL